MYLHGLTKCLHGVILRFQRAHSFVLMTCITRSRERETQTTQVQLARGHNTTSEGTPQIRTPERSTIKKEQLLLLVSELAELTNTARRWNNGSLQIQLLQMILHLR